MVLALIFRGVAFEFRWRDPGHRRYLGFRLHNRLNRRHLAQGITLGALLQGISVEGRAYAGGWWDWLTPFSLLVGVSLVIGYALLGATWLVMKTEGTVQEHCFRLCWKARHRTIACIALVSAATPFLSGTYYERWFSWPQVLFTGPGAAACRRSRPWPSWSACGAAGSTGHS